MSFSESTLAQPYIFAAFMYAGIIAGMLLCALRSLKRLFSGSRAAAIVLETVFALLSAGLAAFAAFSAANMKLRLYYVFGFAAGFALARTAVCPLTSALGKKFKIRKVDKKCENGSNIK